MNVAITKIEPDADDWVLTGKPALREPWGTVTLAGSVSPAPVLERPTTLVPANFDMVTVHALLDPAVKLVGAQVSEDRTGVDHSVKLAV